MQGVGFEVREGEIVALLGRNGAGKTSTLRTIARLANPQLRRGEIWLAGKALHRMSSWQAAREGVGLVPDTGAVLFRGKSLIGLKPHEINQAGVARVFQTPEVFADLTLEENVTIPALARHDGAFRLNAWRRLGSRSQVRERALHILEDVGLAAHRDEIAGTLSRGDKRRLELAMCLVQEPKLLLLDEPTAGMSRADTEKTIELLQRIGERRITKVIIEHDMQVVFSLASRISVLAQGTVIAEGAPDAIRGDPRVQEAYLGGAHA